MINRRHQLDTFIASADCTARLHAIGEKIIEAAEAGEINEFQLKKLTAYWNVRLAHFA